LINLDLEAMNALVAYENCYYQDSDISESEEDIQSDNEEEINSDTLSNQEDFPSPLE